MNKILSIQDLRRQRAELTALRDVKKAEITNRGKNFVGFLNIAENIIKPVSKHASWLPLIIATSRFAFSFFRKKKK